MVLVCSDVIIAQLPSLYCFIMLFSFSVEDITMQLKASKLTEFRWVFFVNFFHHFHSLLKLRGGKNVFSPSLDSLCCYRVVSGVTCMPGPLPCPIRTVLKTLFDIKINRNHLDSSFTLEVRGKKPSSVQKKMS